MHTKRQRSKKVTLVRDATAFGRIVPRILEARRLALDTEAASFHRYFDRVFLIQASSDVETWVLDPLQLPDLSVIGRILDDPGVEIVFHDADFDLRNINRDYGFTARNIFDTRIAAELAGEPRVGLGSLLEKHFGVRLDKKFQRADWSARPLPAQMLAYAAADTQHLLPLRDRLAAQLKDAGRLSWALDEFRRLESVRWEPSNSDLPAFLKVKHAKSLEKRSLAVLQAVHEWRDVVARSRDAAPFRVLGDQMLISVARVIPRDLEQLEQAGVPARVVARSGREILGAVTKGSKASHFVLPRAVRTPRPKSDPVFDRRVERLKQLRDERAKSLSLPAGVLCPNGTIQALARAAPTDTVGLKGVNELRNWQRKAIGEKAILGAVRGTD